MAGERQVAIVTGAGSGIGHAMTLGLLEGGIDVAAVDKEPVWLDELKAAVAGRRFEGALRIVRAPAQAAERCGAPIAWKSIATMPIEPD
jgi:NADP-dependent 3-hydroxy acid dehydrogenase YdfG